ncbi:MAG: MMPL family transporter [Chloroflexi bacterium]|nr:MMPL family transporter [Chloroflexota bacterium]
MAINLSTEALARVSARHPWRTIAVWVVLITVAVGLNATLLGDALTTEFSFTNNPDSQKADRLLEDRLRGPKKASEIIVVQHQTLEVDEGAFQERVESLYQQIVALGGDKIAGGTHYYQSGDESLVSRDRKTTIMPLSMAGSFDEATENVEEVLEIVRRVNGTDGFTALIAGESSIAFESNELAVADIEQGEKIGVPIALIILLVLFGAVVAALIPIFLAAVAIIVALGATALLGQVFDLIFFVTLMITMIGLAVGIDYSLIVVSRFREEMRRGRDRFDAIARTGATASRTVFFSGITVVVALSGLLIVPSSVYQSLATGAILVVVSAVAASLTLLPAALALLGERVDSLRVPFIGRRLSRPSRQSGGGFWAWLTEKVMAYPVVSMIVTAGVLIAAAVPAFDINTGFNGVDSFPDEAQSKAAFLVLEEEFSFGLAAPTEIAIDGDVESEPVRAAVERLRAILAQDSDFSGELPLEVSPTGDLGLLTVTIAGETSGERAVNAVKRLRSEYIPEAFSDVDAEVLVTGATAFNIDFVEIADRFMPIVFSIVLGLSFVLLTLVFRSIVVPLKAIVMNLLSVGAAYGLMVLVFQKGFAIDLLGFQRAEVIDAWIPLFLFSILFGLSMDYHLFLLSRIRERYDQTGDNTAAVSYGLRATAGLITGAALIMVAVFGGFASGVLVSNQQVGFGLAVAILLDATVVRSILVPSSMRLLGDWNWYLPRFLQWLPDLRVEAEPEAAEAAADD